MLLKYEIKEFASVALSITSKHLSYLPVIQPFVAQL